MSEAQYLSGWRYWAVILSVVFSAIGYLVFSLWGGWDEVANAIAKVGMLGVVFALLMSLLNYGLRFLRWQTYLKALGHFVPWQPSLQIYLAGFALTTTPGKAGEALRGVLLKRWGVPYPQSFAAFFSERLSDLFAIVLMTLFGLSLYPGANFLIGIGVTLVMFGFVVLTQHRLIHRIAAYVPEEGGKLISILRHTFLVLLEAKRCHQWGILLVSMLLSITAWCAEALAFYWVLNWMGADITFAFAVFVYSIAMLAGALSFMPGGLGGTEVVMVALLAWKGMPNADAIAATVLIRMTTLWFAVAIGVFYLLCDQYKNSRVL